MNLDMINDESRLRLCIFPAIDRIPKNKIVLDIGCGTGLIGMYALAAGAKFVYFLEQDPQMLHILHNTLPKILPSARYTIISKDIEELTREDFKKGVPHYITSEFYGPTLFDEGYINYTAHLRAMFRKAHFIPEIFETELYVADVDYTQSLWPKEENAIEQFKFMYAEKGFINGFTGWFDPINPQYVGSIKFDANRQHFENGVTFLHKGNEKILYCKNVIKSGENNHVFSFYGWYLPFSKKKKTYHMHISLQDETIFQPRLNLVDIII